MTRVCEVCGGPHDYGDPMTHTACSGRDGSPCGHYGQWIQHVPLGNNLMCVRCGARVREIRHAGDDGQVYAVVYETDPAPVDPASVLLDRAQAALTATATAFLVVKPNLSKPDCTSNAAATASGAMVRASANATSRLRQEQTSEAQAT